MDVVLTSAGMRAGDRHAVARYGMPSSLLMENAGRQVADAALGLLTRGKGGPVVLVCGVGNNGGDGFVAARRLAAAGARVQVVLVGRPSRLKGDSLLNFTILGKLKKDPALKDRLGIVVDPSARRLSAMSAPSLVIDALLGTGFRGRLDGAVLRAVDWINARACPTVSVDIPTGLDADSGSVENECVQADVTVTMGRLKTGLLLGRGPAQCGRVVVADLGVPVPDLSQKSGGSIRLVGPDDVRRALPERPFDAHKHSVGKILVLAGSVGFTGAAALSAGAAMKSGAGAVVLATPRSVYPILSRKLTEIMVKPVEDTPEGAFCENSLDAIGRELGWADVIIVGPGIGTSGGTGAFLEKLLRTAGKRFLIDADGLNLLAGNNALKGILRRNTCILTPHAGEFSRLTGQKTDRIAADVVRFARDFAKKHKITLILKGAPTLTADRGGNIYINPTGNRGMATAGMGDVLTGIVGSIWAESGDPVSAAYAGVYLHGRAGDSVAGRIGYRSLMAGDVLNEIPKVIDI